MNSGFYGTDHDTYFVTHAGRVWHVQNSDGAPVREVQTLPEGTRDLDDSDCSDLDLSDTSADEDKARAEGWAPTHDRGTGNAGR